MSILQLLCRLLGMIIAAPAMVLMLREAIYGPELIELWKAHVVAILFITGMILSLSADFITTEDSSQ